MKEGQGKAIEPREGKKRHIFTGSDHPNGMGGIKKSNHSKNQLRLERTAAGSEGNAKSSEWLVLEAAACRSTRRREKALKE